MGLCISACPLLISVIRNRRLQCAAEEIFDAEEARRVSELSSDLALERSVRLLETGRSIIPMTWGILKPIVLFPKAWRNWTDQRRRLVLLHELAHVKRFDVAYQLVARWACVLYWFHPLAWYALRRSRIERELACDDCVLMAGARPSDYAKELLEIARHYHTVPLATAVAMAQRTSLEQRIRLLLDAARSHMPLGRRAGRLLLVISILLVVATAVVQPVEVAQAEPHSTKTSDGLLEDEVQVAGQVLLPDGTPAPDATVTFQGGKADEVLTTKTGADGRFSLTFDKSKIKEPALHLEPWRRAVLTTVADGFAPAFLIANELEGTESPTLTLRDDDFPVRGQILDQNRRPVTNARLELLSVSELTEQTGTRDLAGWRYNVEVPIGSLDTTDPNGVTIVPDESGRFELWGLGNERAASIRVQGPDLQSSQIFVVMRPSLQKPDDNSEGRQEPDNYMAFGPAPTFYPAEFAHVMAPGVSVSGLVTDISSGQPIGGVEIRGRVLNEDNYAVATTNSDGQYTLNGLAQKGTLSLYVESLPVTTSLPYISIGRELELSPSEPLTPEATHLRLTKGIVVHGRVVDRVTEEGLPAQVRYLTYDDNSHVAALDGAIKYTNAFTDRDGRYSIAVLPGTGTLAVKVASQPSDMSEKYLCAPVRDFNRSNDKYRRYGLISIANGGLVAANQYHCVEPISFQEGEQPSELRVAVSPVTNIDRVRCRSTSGKLLNHVSVTGHLPWDGEIQAPDSGLELGHGSSRYIPVANMHSSGRKPVVFRHAEENLAVILFASDSDRHPGLDDLVRDSDGVYQLQLSPGASLAGRFVHDDGTTVESPGILYLKTGGSNEEQRIAVTSFYVDSEGRKEVKTIPSGGPYVLRVEDAILPDLMIPIGARFDLGTINIDADPSTWPKPIRRSSPINSQ